jgi:hypothetical protein
MEEDMKRSTAIQCVAREIDDGITSCQDVLAVAERVVATLEANRGWDPEEPELPRRLIREREFVWNAVDGKGEESFGIIDLSVLIDANMDNLTYRVLHEAFAAYNREREAAP